MLLLVKLETKTCNFTKSNFSPWVFFTFFKLYKQYEIAQSVSYDLLRFNVGEEIFHLS